MHRVLVVDDEKVLAASLTEVLQNAGYQPRAVFSASEAITAMNEFRPDIIISDVIMPGGNGIDLAMKLREQCPDCIVVLFSGNAATQGLLDHARAQGFGFDVIAKPIHPRELLKRLQDILDGCML